MPVLSELTIVQRKNTILEIARRMQLNPDEKLADLCEVMGITEGIYHYWIREDPDMVEMFRQMITDLSREELTSVIAVRAGILQRLILDGINPMTSTSERLQVMRYLDDRAEKLADKHRATGDESAREFLNGPTLKSANSRYASSTVNIAPQDDGSVNVTLMKEVDVIDAESKDTIQTPVVETPKKLQAFLPHRLEEVDLNSLAASKSLLSQEAEKESGQSQPLAEPPV